MLTVKDYLLTIQKAYKDLDENSGLRYGQALFNNLPTVVTNQIRGTPQDMTYDTDLAVIDNKLYALLNQPTEE